MLGRIMNNAAEISMPAAKAVSAITVTAAAHTDAPNAIAQAATVNASWATFVWVNSISWDTVAQVAAVVYTSLLITEWFWKKLWRPLFERKGWLKPKRRHIITLREYEQLTETQRAEL